MSPPAVDGAISRVRTEADTLRRLLSKVDVVTSPPTGGGEAVPSDEIDELCGEFRQLAAALSESLQRWSDEKKHRPAAPPGSLPRPTSLVGEFNAVAVTAPRADGRDPPPDVVLPERFHTEDAEACGVGDVGAGVMMGASGGLAAAAGASSAERVDAGGAN